MLSLAQVQHVIDNSPVQIEGVRFRQPVRDGRGSLPLSSYRRWQVAQHGVCFLRLHRYSGLRHRTAWRPASATCWSTGSVPVRMPATDVVQGSVPGRWQHLLRTEEADQPQHPRPAATPGRGRRRGDQTSRPPAQPGLCAPGDRRMAGRDRQAAGAARPATVRGPNGSRCWPRQRRPATTPGAFTRPWQ